MITNRIILEIFSSVLLEGKHYTNKRGELYK